MQATVSSLSVEQARKDVQHGQEDIQSLKSVCMGISFTVGAAVAAYTIAIGEPWIPFAITFVICMVASIQAYFLSRELETNEQATVKDRELLKYEQRKR